MSWLSPVELVGYLASALVVTSLTMTSVVRLRMISLVGSITFVIYGVLIGSVPIVITNAAIALINLFFLRRELGGQRDLGAVPIASDAPFLSDFLRSHAEDIKQFQPNFTGPGPQSQAFLLNRDGLPAGVVIGRRLGEEFHIDLDYVLRAYRDSRLGAWMYGAGTSAWCEDGVTRLLARATTTDHTNYLRGVGFTPDGDRWVRAV